MQHENIAFVAEDYPIYVTETLEHTVAYKRLHVFFPECRRAVITSYQIKNIFRWFIKIFIIVSITPYFSYIKIVWYKPYFQKSEINSESGCPKIVSFILSTEKAKIITSYV